MLVKLIPEQVSSNWKKLRPSLKQSLPPQIAASDDAMKNILKNILDGTGTLWAYIDEDRIAGVVLTRPDIDPLTETGSLLIYAAVSFGGVTQEFLEDSVETLTKHAESEGLQGLIAFSENDALIRFLKQQGAKANYTLISYNPEQ